MCLHGDGYSYSDYGLDEPFQLTIAGVVDGFLQQSPRVVLRGAVVQAPSLGLARVGREREASRHEARPLNWWRNSTCGLLHTEQSSQRGRTSFEKVPPGYSQRKGTHGGLLFQISRPY